MDYLLVFDDSISIKDLDTIINKDNSIILFPLTSKQHIINQIENECRTYSAKSVEIIESAQLVNETADKIRDSYIEFIARLPEKMTGNGKNLKERFYYPDVGISLWWFSLMTEKNMFKSDSFHRLAQLYSVIKVIEESKIGNIAISCSGTKLAPALELYCKQHSLQFLLLPNNQGHWISRLKNKYPIIKALGSACIYLSYDFIKWISIKCLMRNNLKSTSYTNNPILFVTYYPNIDKTAAETGVFKNKYYLPLQEELEKQRRDIIWAAMYTRGSGMTFFQSLRYARQFSSNGYHFIFVERFWTLNSFLKALKNILRSLIQFKKLEKELPRHHYLDTSVCIYHILRDDWCTSLCGSTGIENLMYLEAFKNMFKKLPVIHKGVYCCEMHAWEKALLTAKNTYAKDMELIAFQHSIFSRMLLHFFNHPSELHEGKSKHPMPKPDRIACGGERPYKYFKESGWTDDELVLVEAIRFNHLRNITRYEEKQKQDIVMVIFSISIDESIAMLNAVYEAFKGATNVQVWLKPHPFLPMDIIFSKSGISPGDAEFQIKKDRIEDLLPIVKGVISGQSGAGLEALAYGCKVIGINSSDIINMSPLRGIESNKIIQVNSAHELREVVSKMVNGNNQNDSGDEKGLINQFYYFNKDSSKPEKFLELLS